MLLPVIAIVGRPNVGKSTLFNCLTHSRDALVADMPGVTRDRIYGHGQHDDQPFILIDTGGIAGDGTDGNDEIADLTEQQAQAAMTEADIILLIVDGKEGLQLADQLIVESLRQYNKKVILVVNKTDGLDEEIAAAEFYALGFDQVAMIAAAHRRGTQQLLTMVLDNVVSDQDLEQLSDQQADVAIEQQLPSGVRVAVIGRPNVGKSTLINRLLGEDRVLVCDMPGTTRDSVFIPFQYRGEDCTLIDTAGVRRRARVNKKIEQLSVIKSLQAIQAANVVVLVIDAQVNISEQDLKLLGQVVKSGRALIIAINKWDGLSSYQRQRVEKELDRRLSFISYAERQYISALHGSGVGLLMEMVKRCYRCATQPLQTATLTAILERALRDHQPPLVKGRRIKLRYAHPGGMNPPTIIIHGNQVNKLPMSYQRYLENTYRKSLKLVGTPIRLLFKTGDNPFDHQ